MIYIPLWLQPFVLILMLYGMYKLDKYVRNKILKK